MPFTRAWDETFPPDTQAANQLGLDIRQEKTDTRERIVAFAAGRLADRETPEAVFGDVNKGVLFFSLDEGRVYRWNGAAWVDVTSSVGGSLVIKNIVPVTIVNPNINSVGMSLVIPANTLQVGDLVEISTAAYHSVGAVSAGLKIRFGGVSLSGGGNMGNFQASTGALEIFATIVVLGAASQVSYARSNFGGFVTQGTHLALAADITTPITVDLIFSPGDGAGTYVFDWIYAKILK